MLDLREAEPGQGVFTFSGNSSDGNPFSVDRHGREVAVLGNLEIHRSRLMWLY
jgi:hypothetical protein